MKSTRIPLADRFWPKVQKSDGCWEWTAYKNEKGYGHIGNEGGTKSLKAPRVSWELHNGPIPDGLCVLHRCDNPGCVNPEHLFLGTRGDNFRDCLSKGRRPIGNPRLTAAQVIEILAMTGTHQTIADHYGVCRPTVTYIKNGSTWQHIHRGAASAGTR